MSEPINIRSLASGTTIALTDGATVEIVSNPSDRVWVFARYLSSPTDPARWQREDGLCPRHPRDLRDTRSEA
jgi:hypothetical protein